MKPEIQTLLPSSLEELKEFLLWARNEGIVSIKVDGIEAIFNPESKLPKEAKGIVDGYWKAMSNNKVNEMSLDNPLLFDAVS